MRYLTLSASLHVAVRPDEPAWQVEFLGMAGLCGTVIAGLQTILLERKAIAEVEWTYTIVLFIAGYSLRSA